MRRNSAIEPAAMRKLVKEIVSGCVDACDTRKADVAIQGTIVLEGEYDYGRDGQTGVDVEAAAPIETLPGSSGKVGVGVKRVRSLEGEGGVLIEVQFKAKSLKREGQL